MAWTKKSVVALAAFVGMQLGGWIAGLPLEMAPAAAQDFCPDDSQRAVIFANKCAFPVWIGFAGGSIPCKTNGTLKCPTSTSTCRLNPPSTTDGSCTCTSDADCGAGQACNTDPNVKLCFWTLPAPVDDNNKPTFKLEAPGSGPATAKSCLPQRNLVQLSGNLFGRTGCVFNGANILTCQTANCASAPGSSACLPGTGGTPPATLAEFTLQNSFSGTVNKDFYDISIINGVNVSMQMAPIGGTYSAEAGDPYSCQTPGSPAASSTGLKACSWKFTPSDINGALQTTLLRFVNATHFTSQSQCPYGSTHYSQSNVCLCTKDGECSSGNLVCGLAQGQIVNQPGGLGQVCGTAIGEWSADQICGTNPNFKTLDGSLDCAKTFKFNSKPGTTTLTNLLLCPRNGAESCSNNMPTPSTDCCGCATFSTNKFSKFWPKVFGLGDKCYNNNPTWAQNIQNWLAFMKLACPTAYTYPYDDMTSTFTCLSNRQHGGVGYRITYCPEN